MATTAKAQIHYIGPASGMAGVDIGRWGERYNRKAAAVLKAREYCLE